MWERGPILSLRVSLWATANSSWSTLREVAISHKPTSSLTFQPHKASHPNVSQDRPDRLRPASRRNMRINPRNIPVHIVFWAFVLFLLYMFVRVFMH